MREQYPVITLLDDARVVDEGRIITVAGVSAGIDMALHLIGRLAGPAVRDEIATRMEYTWHSDAAHDPFAKIYGLA